MLMVQTRTEQSGAQSVHQNVSHYQTAIQRSQRITEESARAQRRLSLLESSRGFRQSTEEPECTLASELKARAFSLRQQIDSLEAQKQPCQESVGEAVEKLRKAAERLVHGGVAGVAARTGVAPLDRVKILLQTQQHTFRVPGPNERTHRGTFQVCQQIFRQEGVQGLWRGNGINAARVFPYSAVQFASYDFFKTISAEQSVSPVLQKIGSGTMAGVVATTVTHPLDVVRLRLTVAPKKLTVQKVSKQIWREGGVRALYQGFFPSLFSLCPFIAVNFMVFDVLQESAEGICSRQTPQSSDQQNFQKSDRRSLPVAVTLGLGAVSGLAAQTLCYPLDTVKRKMQLRKTTSNSSIQSVCATVWRQQGIRGFYRGMAANAIKIVPGNAIRFWVYTTLQSIQ